MQLDDIHSCHGKTCTIHHAPNAALQPDVIQVILAGRYIPACDTRTLSPDEFNAFERGELGVIKSSCSQQACVAKHPCKAY